MKSLKNVLKVISPCTLMILSVNVIIYIVCLFVGSEDVSEKYSLAWWMVYENGEYYRILTYMFLHSGISHLINNMLVLGFLGSAVERLVGAVRYLFLYFGTGMIAGIASLMYSKHIYESGAHVLRHSVGASGAVFGITGAMIYIVVLNRGYVAGISLRRLILFAVLSAYAGITSPDIDNIAHIAGIVFGFIGTVPLYKNRLI